MQPRNVHWIFYGIAAAPWLLLSISRSPSSLVLPIGCISAISVMFAKLVCMKRRKAELGQISMTEDPTIKDISRIVADDLLKAIGNVELLGRRLRHELSSSQDGAIDPEALRQLKLSLDSARDDLSRTRQRLNEFTAF